MSDALTGILETTTAERPATGFVFTEGPLWHPDGFYYFVDIRQSRLHRLTPGKEPELVRAEHRARATARRSTCRVAWSSARAATGASRGGPPGARARS